MPLISAEVSQFHPKEEEQVEGLVFLYDRLLRIGEEHSSTADPDKRKQLRETAYAEVKNAERRVHLGAIPSAQLYRTENLVLHGWMQKAASELCQVYPEVGVYIRKRDRGERKIT